MGAMAPQSPASWLFTQPFIQTQIKENIKAPRHWPSCGEFTGDRWIPRTNGQVRGKCLHLMTSSWHLLFCCPTLPVCRDVEEPSCVSTFLIYFQHSINLYYKWSHKDTVSNIIDFKNAEFNYKYLQLGSIFFNQSACPKLRLLVQYCLWMHHVLHFADNLDVSMPYHSTAEDIAY